jgi:hypothetical protein
MHSSCRIGTFVMPFASISQHSHISPRGAVAGRWDGGALFGRLCERRQRSKSPLEVSLPPLIFIPFEEYFPLLLRVLPRNCFVEMKGLVCEREKDEDALECPRERTRLLSLIGGVRGGEGGLGVGLGPSRVVAKNSAEWGRITGSVTSQRGVFTIKWATNRGSFNLFPLAWFENRVVNTDESNSPIFMRDHNFNLGFGHQLNGKGSQRDPLFMSSWR